MRPIRLAAITALAIPAVLAAQAERAAASDSVWTWKGTVPVTGTFGIFSSQGDIDVKSTTGTQIEVRGTKRSGRWRRARNDLVEFEVRQTDGGGITICAIAEDASCGSGGISHDHRGRWNDDGEPRVDFTVLLPAGVHLAVGSGNGDVMVNASPSDVRASSGNGEVTVSSASGSVKASSGNGRVTVEHAGGPVDASSGNGRVVVNTASGPVSASSGNGDIDVRMNALSGSDDMTFRTGNGRISVTVPNEFNAEVDANQPRGEIRTDFPITIEGGRMGSGHLRGTIGKGGRRLRMSTGNGTIEIRKG